MRTISPTARAPRTAFVLSGGASLGAMQVGMLRALYERGITPDLLVGTSAGALNAAFLASRPPTVATTQELEDVKRVAETLGVQNLVRLARAPAAPVYTLVLVTDEERLSKMLKDFPSVRVGRMSGQLYVSGSVRTDQDLEVVRRIVAALGAQTIVSVIPGTKP